MMAEEARSSTPKSNESLMSQMKKGCLSFTTSMYETLTHIKATFVGQQAKKITAKNEKEATEADLQTAKMQVDATNEAESTKKGLGL
ncbi:hypothetical protein GIB67_005620 [Kingdonia uniflora]|uniref:Uncharacterized protein n=1 Tax=Kingdonia uniflora TaxID=39325 RepID=A0A7J7NID7_9MAGN|nr:hypothetical protein GIB67_005620 [Kingdonia uniflora]